MVEEKVMFLNRSNVISGNVVILVGVDPLITAQSHTGNLKRASESRCGWFQVGETDVTGPNHSH